MKSFLQILFFFFLLNQLTFPQWVNQNPVPDGNDLWSTFFVDDNTGWIVGSDGFIKKTTNAGLDWIQQNSGTTLILKSVQFINLNTGWICGEGGLILKTTDGGSSWDSLTSGTTEHLTDIDFCDVDTGYVVGFSGTILKTTDGGSVWASQSSGTSFNLTSVDFVDSFVGYTVGGDYDTCLVLKTTDGGASWIDKSSGLLPLPHGILLAVKFINANTGFVGAWLPNDEDFIYKTTDAGNTWTLVLHLWKGIVQNYKERLSIYNDYGGINSIFFKDSNIGYAVGGDRGGYSRKIYTTTNGGSTWTYKFWYSEESGLTSVFVNNAGKGWVVGYNGVIFMTEDDGNSWSQILSGKGYNCASGDDIHSVFFINENVGWAIGDRQSCYFPGPIILKTTNGGKIWKTQLYLQSYPWYEMASVYFINENIGWAMGEGSAFFRTTNGGENWIEGSFPVPYLTINNVYFINGSTGWAVDDKIYKTTDGGANWVEKSNTSGNAIHFSDINNGWVCGQGGIIMRSFDGGETWSNQNSGITADLSCIRFFDNNIGMCVGNGGILLTTINGGTNWNTKNAGTTANLNFIQYINSVTVMVNRYLYTTDGGNSWEQLSNGYHFTSKYTGWLWGENNIFRYDEEPAPLPTWSNQVIIEDAGGTESSGVLTFGQHVEATDSIDASLGEYELPPLPPTGIFDSRFNLPTSPQMSSLIDYRDSAKTDIIWNMTFQPGAAGYPMTFSWDSTAFPEGTFYLKDSMNGSYVFVNMKNQSNYTLTEPAITSLNISYRGLCTTMSVNNEWNMVSVPVLVEDMELSNLFPTATSAAYTYNSTYIMEDTLVVGVGYWLKFGANEEIQICGLSMGDTVSVLEGWNMFGIYENDIPVSQITTTPPGIVATYFFGFNNGYYIADTLKTGQGFWVRVTENGVLNLNGGTLEKEGEERQPIAKVVQDWGRIKITDSEGKSVTLYATEEETDLGLYELPPLPPSGVFDVRYSTGSMVENLSSEKIMQINSNSYPVTIKAEGISITIKDRINGELLNEELTDGEELRIMNSKITAIEVTGKITGGLPVSYELFQNYPNPFNPSTTIKFAIPKESNVNLSIYNVLGELVTTLVNGQMNAGYYEYEFSAIGGSASGGNNVNLSSGVYLYRIKAGDFIKTSKMVLVK